MQASGSASWRPARRPNAIGRLYHLDASNCQSAADFAGNLTTIKGGRGVACQYAASREGAFRTPNQ